MERRSLGRSGIEVPVIGFGCGGSARLMVGPDRAAQEEAIRLAIEMGVDYFDTAPAYGDGRSEANLGSVLEALGSPPVTVSTKVVLQDEDLESSGQRVMRSFERSLERLRRDRVDMLLLHNRVARTRPEGRRVGVGPVLGLADVFDPGGVAEVFRELIDAGVVRGCGITALGGEPAAVTEVLRSGLVSVMNAALSLVEPTSALAVPPPGGGEDHGQVVSVAEDLGIGVIAVRVFGSGRLLLPAEDPLTGEVQRLAAEIGAGDAHRGALGFALAVPGVSTAVIGFSEPAHVRAAVEAAAEPLSPDLVTLTAGRLAALGSAP